MTDDRTARRRGDDALVGVDHLMGILSSSCRYDLDVMFLVRVFQVYECMIASSRDIGKECNDDVGVSMIDILMKCNAICRTC